MLFVQVTPGSTVSRSTTVGKGSRSGSSNYSETFRLRSPSTVGLPVSIGPSYDLPGMRLFKQPRSVVDRDHGIEHLAARSAHTALTSFVAPLEGFRLAYDWPRRRHTGLIAYSSHR
jgi:hypothetical protein